MIIVQPIQRNIVPGKHILNSIHNLLGERHTRPLKVYDGIPSPQVLAGKPVAPGLQVAAKNPLKHGEEEATPRENNVRLSKWAKQLPRKHAHNSEMHRDNPVPSAKHQRVTFSGDSKIHRQNATRTVAVDPANLVRDNNLTSIPGPPTLNKPYRAKEGR
ncbi:hypothetical protein Hbut_0233 [Hyperthermus butylicus DSM 5456]|uniref:Uncharacterized protein n=1 Tax=Hyperthermus butylicus (strain DSM 5456 / JCM 9403 / PLM1-5) TaxID=415426 RepID=A2BJE5_HYPBU|nr:hypothetical protein Hbut_0233 [Hyperthermus butylicus DSM 5456]